MEDSIFKLGLLLTNLLINPMTTSTTQLKQDQTVNTNENSIKPWAYTIEESRFGLFTSILSDGTRMVTGLTEDACRWCTDNIHIPVLRGEFDGYTSKPRSSVVGGKL